MADTKSDAVAKKPAQTTENEPARGPLGKAWEYIRGSWTELREVRWPNRRSTWSLTLAVLGFSAFFVVLILLVDAGFQYLFRQVLLK